MARKVFVSSDMGVDERLVAIAAIEPLAQLVWPWLLTYMDDWGRAQFKPLRIKTTLFPANPLITVEVVDQSIRLFADPDSCGDPEDEPLLYLYEVDGKTYMAVPHDKWFGYQTHIRKAKRDTDDSKYPSPPQESRVRAQVRDDARDDAQVRDDARTCQQMLTLPPSPSPSPSPSENPPTPQGDSLGGHQSSEHHRNLRQEASGVFEHYRLTFGDLWKRPLKLTDDRRRMIETRLKTFSVDECRAAIDNARASPYHCGDNEKGRIYATPEFLFRKDAQTDLWASNPNSERRRSANGAQTGRRDPPSRTAADDDSIDWEAVARGETGEPPDTDYRHDLE